MPDIDAIMVIFGTPGLVKNYEVYDVLHKKIQECRKPIFPILPSVGTAGPEVQEFLNRGHVNFSDEVTLATALTQIKWLRRRLRMCIWKSWKKPRTRVRNLIQCGIDRWRAYQWGNTSKGYWRIADSWILTRAIGDEAFRKAGYSWIGCYYSASALPKG